MQVLKRRILLEDYVDRSHESPTYGAITATSFYIKVVMTQKMDDMGIMTDAPFIPSSNSKKESDFYAFGRQVISGTTESKINDTKSYSATNPYQVGIDVHSSVYTNFSGQTIQGVDRVVEYGANIVYAFDAERNDSNIGTLRQKNGMVFKEDTNGVTNTYYRGEGWNQTNTSFSASTKEEYLFGIISSPEVKNELFIDRGATPVMEKHLKLSEIRNLGQLERYGNGFFSLI